MTLPNGFRAREGDAKHFLFDDSVQDVSIMGIAVLDGPAYVLQNMEE